MPHPSITLPPRLDGTRLDIPPGHGQIIIIGANGAGKTRFADYLLGEQGEGHSMRLSALDAVAQGGAFDSLMRRLMHDELLSLIYYKLHFHADPELRPERTRLDAVIDMWHTIFPDNRILVESGEMLFTRVDDADTYSATRLSAGERTVLYYLAATLYAPADALVFVDNSAMFLHPSVLASVWNMLEDARPDCTFIYTTHDLDFVATRSQARIVWVRGYDAAARRWDYDILPPDSGLSDDIYLAILGARKHVMFIEGDGINSIDAKLYPLVFKNFTVKSLGSCNKVIEATRAFRDLAGFHHLDSYGIVDRDRRDDREVKYLRERKIFVPEVAEIENILMLEEVIRTVADARSRSENHVFGKVKRAIIAQFKTDLKHQALLHTRHRVKRTMEYRIDGRFSNINDLEDHITDLVHEINPRGMYENFCREFRRMVADEDYASILRVYNQKSMLPSSNVAGLLGLRNKDEYIAAVIDVLRHEGAPARRMRTAIIKCFRLPAEEFLSPAKNPEL